VAIQVMIKLNNNLKKTNMYTCILQRFFSTQKIFPQIPFVVQGEELLP